MPEAAMDKRAGTRHIKDTEEMGRPSKYTVKNSRCCHLGTCYPVLFPLVLTSDQ